MRSYARAYTNWLAWWRKGSWRSISRLTRKRQNERLLSGTKHMTYQSMESWTPSREDFPEEEALPPNVNDMHELWCHWIREDLIALWIPLFASWVPTWKTWFLTRMIWWWYLSSLKGVHSLVRSRELDWHNVLGNVHQFVVNPRPVGTIRWVLHRLHGRSGRSTRVCRAEDDLLWRHRIQDDYHQVHRC